MKEFRIEKTDDRKNLESLLNTKENISHFELSKHFFLIHLKNGETVEIQEDDGQLAVNYYNK